MKFGTDGIRGKVGEGFFIPQNIVILGMAIGDLILKKERPTNVLIARDTRESGPMIEMALSSGLSSKGINIYSMGVLPTPAVSHLIQKRNDMAYGIVISASHNPYYDNGIKIFSNNGYKLSQEDKKYIEKIYKNIENNELFENIIKNYGTYKDISKETEQNYIKLLTDKFKYSLKNKSILIDTANGAFSFIAEKVFKSLGANTRLINNSPNGKNINDKCGATHLDNLVQEIKQNPADLAISFDGDGDRLMLVDKHGNILDGDYILAILANKMKKNNKLHRDTVIITPMTNLGFIKAMEKLNIKTIEVPVGDQNITDIIIKEKYSLGGEQSGHIIIAKDTRSGDGIVTALELLKVIVEDNSTLEEEAKLFTKYPQILIGIPVKEKIPLNDIPNFTKTYKEIEEELKDNGRINVRYSGTEPLLRIMLEGQNPSRLKELSENLKQTLKTLN